MIHVVIKEGDIVLGEMRIEEMSPSVYSVEFAADSGGGWVDLKRRVLYGFNSAKYNALALVSEALNLLDLNDMEWHDAENLPGRMAGRQRGGGEEVSHKALDSKRHHRSAFWRR